jgi:hypothetical protein
MDEGVKPGDLNGHTWLAEKERRRMCRAAVIPHGLVVKA